MKRTALAGVTIATLIALPAAAQADPPSSCADLGGTVDAEQICHVRSETADYGINFAFPVDYPDQDALADYVTKRRDDFISFTEQRPSQDRPYELDATATMYGSGKPDSGTRSVVFDVYSDSGGAHPVTGYESFTYDLGKGAPITFDTLFRPGTEPVELLDTIVRRQWENLSGDYGPIGENTSGARTYQSFALTDGAVIFFIGQGQWLPQVAGPREVSVPRTELASILA